MSDKPVSNAQAYHVRKIALDKGVGCSRFQYYALDNGMIDAMMDSLVVSSQLPGQEWQIRRNVIERLMLRPLRTYRTQLIARQTRGQAEARALIEAAAKIGDDDVPPLEPTDARAN